MFFLYFLLSLFCFCSLSTKEVILFNLVHGTWAQKSTWHKEQGGFFEMLKNWATKKYTTPQVVSINSFEWSGKLTHESRLKAAKQLVYSIKELPVDTTIHIIAHSHGANVVFLASNILAQEKSKHHIEICFLLGAPINVKKYKPCMDKISYVYNMFSFKDYVQTVFGTYERVLPEHERIMNVEITINGTQPGHSELISEVLAKWLPTFHEICQQKQDSFKLCNSKKPGIVHFFEHKKPLYALNIHQKKSLEYDKQIQRNMFDTYCKSTNTHDTYPQKEINIELFESTLDRVFSFEHQPQELNKDA